LDSNILLKYFQVSYARPSSSDIKNANLYVSNLPASIQTTSDLEALFSKYGTIITSRLLVDNNYKPRGIGFVRFNLRQEASAAIAGMNGMFLAENSAPLNVKFAKTVMNSGGMNFSAPPLTPKPKIFNQYVLYVCNLENNVQESTLMELFAGFGFVADISIIRNQWRKTYAFVTMLNHKEAMNACRYLSGVMVGSKQILVSFKKDK
jgi:RNA recognition motif-containing protein